MKKLFDVLARVLEYLGGSMVLVMTLFGIYNVVLDAKALAVRGDGTEDDG